MYEDLLKKAKKIIEEDGAKVYDIALYGTDKNGKEFSDYEKLQPVYGPTNCYSVSKTFTSTAIGIACDRGLISTDDYLCDILKAFLPSNMPEGYKKVKIHHLLCQTTGIKTGILFEENRYETKDLLKKCLTQPLEYEPGETFVYSNSNTYLLSKIISIITGQKLDMFVRKNIFEPLDINIFAWERCPMDEPIGCSGLYLYTQDMIKLGKVYLNGGMNIISKNWINKATADSVKKNGQPKYGYCIWIRDEGYEMNGLVGQIIRVFPKRNLVFAAHSGSDYDYNKMLYKAFEQN